MVYMMVMMDVGSKARRPLASQLPPFNAPCRALLPRLLSVCLSFTASFLFVNPAFLPPHVPHDLLQRLPSISPRVPFHLVEFLVDRALLPAGFFFFSSAPPSAFVAAVLVFFFAGSPSVCIRHISSRHRQPDIIRRPLQKRSSEVRTFLDLEAGAFFAFEAGFFFSSPSLSSSAFRLVPFDLDAGSFFCFFSVGGPFLASFFWSPVSS